MRPPYPSRALLYSLQVWYHVCSSRGKGCYNTRLKEDGGCTIWYNEMQVSAVPPPSAVLAQ